MTCAAFAALILLSARAHHVPPSVVDSQIFRESTCRPGAVNRRTGAVGLGQILPGGSASLRHPASELADPALNVELTARHLHRCFVLCGTWAGARRVYGGHRSCSAGPT